MQGTILEFNTTTNQGIISSSDSGRYSFTIHQWKSSNTKPKTGMSVDFIVSNNTATEIYSIDTPNCANIVSDVSEKSVPIIKTIFKWAVIGGVLFLIAVGISIFYDYLKEKNESSEMHTKLNNANSLLSNNQYESAINAYQDIIFSYHLDDKKEQMAFNRAYAFYKLKEYSQCSHSLGALEHAGSYGQVPEEFLSVELYILRATCLQHDSHPVPMYGGGSDYEKWHNERFKNSFERHFVASSYGDIESACKLGDCDTTTPLEQKVENYYHKLNP